MWVVREGSLLPLELQAGKWRGSEQPAERPEAGRVPSWFPRASKVLAIAPKEEVGGGERRGRGWCRSQRLCAMTASVQGEATTIKGD